MSDDVQITWNGARVKLAAKVGGARGLTMAAHLVQGRSVARTPMDTGDLRSSQIVIPATPDDLVAAVSSDLPYAVRQHEELGYRHRHGQAKFLENALNESRRDINRIVAEQTRRELGGP